MHWASPVEIDARLDADFYVITRRPEQLLDQLIHSFHVSEKTGELTKSVASKLLEGNKKAVVRFLDDLSALDPEDKQRWRRTVARTIDGRVLRSGLLDEG